MKLFTASTTTGRNFDSSRMVDGIPWYKYVLVKAERP